MNKQLIVSALVALMIIIYVLFFPGYKVKQESKITPEDLIGHEIYSTTTSRGLILGLPLKVSMPVCGEGDATPKLDLVSLVTDEHENGNILFAPEYSDDVNCLRHTYTIDGINGVVGRVIEIHQATTEKDITDFLNEKFDTDCIETVTLSPSVFDGTFVGTIKPRPDADICLSQAISIRFSPTKQIFSFVTLGQDWSKYEQDIAESMHF